MDSNKSMDDVAVAIRRHRIHAPYILETKVVSYELAFPDWIHSA